MKLRNGAGNAKPLRPTPSPATGAMNSGLVNNERATLAIVAPSVAPFCRSISTTTIANRNSTQAVNSVAMIEAGALSGPNTRRHIGMPMKPTLL
ncbi:hypothetical protein S58_58290 [Bradyrhizobium oligotrophicum S58]|uniref:Uncharacterized protein n=1 Tax=Bradyrhizobium oligotrophicum S58 TaxID=1245469 RepID=M4ZE55_9BRAD|nr:hypothetical protein S58_58290 [Bradyrhizobium oligotrophicum S58]